VPPVAVQALQDLALQRDPVVVRQPSWVSWTIWQLSKPAQTPSPM
jgi:hypothetical protein